MLKWQCLSCKFWLKAGKRTLRLANTHTLLKIWTKSTNVTVCVLHEFRAANWLSSYCLESWQTNRCQISGHCVSSCTLLLFSPHFYPLDRDVCSWDKHCYPRTHLIALQLNACAACSPLLFSHLTKIYFALRILEWKTLCLSRNCCAIQQLCYRKSLQPDSVTLPSVGSGGLRGS